jgi:hypothetical protein
MTRKFLAFCISVMAAAGTAGFAAVASAGPVSAMKGTNSQGSCEGQYSSQVTHNGPVVEDQAQAGTAAGQPGRSEVVEANLALNGTCPGVQPKR